MYRLLCSFEWLSDQESVGVVRRAVAVLVLVLMIGAAIVGAAFFLPTLFSAGQPVLPKLAASCPRVSAVKVGTISVPAGPIAGYCQDQLVNAAHIINAARGLGIGTHTQAIGVMTAIGESGLRNLSYGDVAGADSRGLFQQRDNGAWGTLADRMDPFTAATNFFDKLTSLPGWKNLSPTEAAHAVQVNADPNYYTAYWADAQVIVAALSGT
jgi:hypothetical protein